MTKKKEATEPTPRWKCPDCSAWVRDDVKEHKCESATSPWVSQGYTCSRCGTWVFWNSSHVCYYWHYPNSYPNISYSTGGNNESAA